MFSFQNGFDYEEFKDMCNSFKKVKLHSKMKSDLLLTDYIFCLAMRRISIDKKVFSSAWQHLFLIFKSEVL